MALTLTSHALDFVRASARKGLVRVVSGGDGRSHRSIDNGATWSAIDIQFPEFYQALAMAYHDGVWVVVGQIGAVSRSVDDGATWTSVASGTTDTLHALTVSAGVFVAAGDSGVVLTSTDGQTWTPRSHALGFLTLNKLASDGATVLVGGFSGKLARSLDSGATWTTISDSGIGTSTIYDILRAGGRWVVTAAERKVSTSLDAVTWNYALLSGASGNSGAALYTGTSWVVGVSGGFIHRSTDGTTWTLVYTHSESAVMSFGAASDTHAVIVGSTGDLILSEDDGATWATQERLASMPLHVAYDAGGWVIGTFSTVYTTSEALAGVPEDIDGTITVTVTAQTGEAITGPIRVQAAASQNITGAIQISALSSSAIGSLPGGWAAAPDGKWQAHVWLGDDDVSDRVLGKICITREDDAAATAQFTIVPNGLVAPLNLIRRRVRITFAQAGGLNSQPMYVGIVERADYDVQRGVITIDCTDNLQQSVSNLATAQIDTLIGGRWSVHVSGEPADGWEYAEARIKSTPQSIALDVSGAVRVVPWRSLPRSMSVTAADVIDESVSVVLPTSTDQRTRVTAKLQYRYPRLRSRGAIASLNLPFGFFVNYDSVTGLTLRNWMTAGMVEQAITGQGTWALVSDPVITQPDAGSYFVTPPDFGGYTLTPDVAATLATGFSARYETRWVQTTTETYTVTLTLPGLEAEIGEAVSEEIGANIQSERETADWSRDTTIEPALIPPAAGDAIEAWQPDGTTSADRDNAILTLMDQAWVRLWSSHRTGRVNFALPLRPDVWLDVWAALNAYGVTASGKVGAVSHLMDTATGEAITNVSLTIGLPGNTAAAQPVAIVPALPAEDLARPLTAYSFEIGAYVGGEAGSQAFDPDTMIGLVTNRVRTGAEGEEAFNFYPYQLSMLAPTIDAIDRDPAELAASVTIETAVPTDLLEIA